MRTSLAHMKDAVMEILLFSVGGSRYGVSLDQVVGVVHEIPRESGDANPYDAQIMLFEGRDVPVFPADDFLADMGPDVSKPSEAIIFDDGTGLYGMAIDATDSVIGVSPGDDLYVLSPQEVSDFSPCRPWGVLTVADRPVLLLDMSRVAAH